jgi:hypothetical protein
MKTKLILGAALLCACALRLAAQPDASTADNASLTAGLGPDGGNIVVEAHGVQPKAPLFYSATVDEIARINPTEVTTEMHIKITILQGHPDVLTLGLSGSGDVIDASGDGLQDWSVRQGTGPSANARFLDLRPALESGKPDPKELDVTVQTRQQIPAIPGTFTVLTSLPGSAVGFSTHVQLVVDPSLQLQVSDADGMMPYGPRTGPQANRDFFTAGAGHITVTVGWRGSAIADAELAGAQLTGTLNQPGNCVDFRLQAVAQVTGSNARMQILSGGAALSGTTAGDGWHVELVRGPGNLDLGGPIPVSRSAIPLRNYSFTYYLVFERTGSIPIDLPFSAGIKENGDWRGLDFRMPAAVVVPVLLQGLPGKVEFDPAASVVPGSTPDGWRGFLPVNGQASMQWKPSNVAEEGTLFFTGNEQTDVRVGAGLLRQTSQVDLRVLQGKMAGVRILLDGPGEILSVEGGNVVGWKIIPEGKQRVLDVRLSQPITTQGTLMIRSQSALGSFPVVAEPLRLTPEGAVRHSGYVRVTNDGAVRLEVTPLTGMMQLAPEQFPGDGPPDGVRQVFVYRFASADYGYRISADQIVPEVNVSQIATYELADTDRVINADIELDIREAPLREWTMTIPSDYSVVSVTGSVLSDYVPDTLATGATRNLKMVFQDAVDGRQLLHLRLEKNQAPAAGEWKLPPLLYPGAKSVRGNIGVVSMPGYRITASGTQGLVEVPLSYFPNQVSGLQQAYRLRDPAWTATMQIAALGQSVQADVFHLYSLKEGIVYGSVLINYFVVGAPANEWRIAVPRTAGNIDVVGDNVRREWRREGDQIVVSLHEPVLGPATLLITFEEPMSARGGTIDPGEVQPLGVQGERGYIQVVSPLQVKYDVTKAQGGLLKIEPLELPTEYRLLTSSPSLVIYQYTTRPFALELNIDWYPPAETADQLVDFAKLSSQISRDGQVVTDARFFVKTRGEKALRMILPEGVSLWEARVDNDVVNARIDGDQILVPLPARMNPNQPVEVALQLGQASARAGHLVLSTPKIMAPMVIGQWTLQSDPDRMLAPEGGNAELRESSRTETGFEWLSIYGRTGVLLMLAVVALAGALLKGGRIPRLTIGLLVCALAIVIAVAMALDATAQRRVNSRTLTYVATVVPAGESVTVNVANLPEWRAMMSLSGVLAVIIGAVVLGSALVSQWMGGEKHSGRLALGAVLLSMGLLAQGGGAILFFVAAAAGIFLVIFIPGFRRWLAAARFRRTASGPIGGAAVAPLLVVAAMLGVLFSAPHAHAAPNIPVILFQDDSKPAESIVQTWQIKKGRLFGQLDMRVRGLKGDCFVLLNAPAVLTSFQGNGLRLTKVERRGQTAYFVASGTDGVFTAQATFEMPASDLSGGIKVPTGAAAIQQVTIQLDQAGWEFSSQQAVSVLPTAGLLPVQSGATLVLGPSEGPIVQFNPKRRNAASEVTQFFAEIANLYIPGPGVVNGFHRITIRPAQGRVSELDFDVPPGFTVGDVKNGPVGIWRFDPQTRKLHVSVDPAQTDAFKFDIETQLGIEALPSKITLEPLRIEGSAGEIGTIGLAFGSDAQPEGMQLKGLSAIDIEDFDASMIPQNRDGNPSAVLQQVYRYGGDGGSVAMTVAPVAPEVRVTTKEVLSLGDDRLVFAVDLFVDITRAGVFKLSFVLPDGLDVEALTGPALSQWTESNEAGQRVITLQLNGRTIGEQNFSLTLSGAAPHAQPEWTVPKVLIREATRQSGDILLAPERGIRLRAVTRVNVSQIDPQAAGDERPGVIGFRLLQQDYTLTVAIEALEPWVTVEALQEVTMREGQTLTRLAMHYRVENAAVKALRVRLPSLTEDQARTVRATGSAVSDLVRVAGTPDTWEIQFQRGIAGETDAQIEYQGESVRDAGNEAVRTPVFEGARQVTLFVAVRGTERLELDSTNIPRGWERLDWSAVPDELQNRSDRSVPALCFKVAEPEGPLVVAVRRHELAESLKVRVTKGTMTTIFSPRGPFMTAVELDADVVEKTMMRVRLPDNAQLVNTFVNGDSVPVVREDDAYLFNVAPGTTGEHQASIQMVYSVPVMQSGGIDLAGPVFSVPMENVSWRVVLPAGYDLRSFRSDLRLNEEQSAGSFGMAEYRSLVVSNQAVESRNANDLLQRANSLLQSGDQQQAGEALDRAANGGGLDAATNEDARVELRVLKTQQAVLGLNTRRQKLYLDNRAGVQERNGQLEQAANLNPLLQGKTNYDPQQYDQLLQGNTAEQNSALNGIATRLVDQQLAAEPAPGAINVTMPERGKVLTFTRSMQVNGDTPLKLDLQLRPLSGTSHGFITLILAAIAIIAVTAIRNPRSAQL